MSQPRSQKLWSEQKAAPSFFWFATLFALCMLSIHASLVVSADPLESTVAKRAEKATNTRINEIQGASFLSAFKGQTISNVTGVSTYVALKDPTNRGLTTVYVQSLDEDVDNDNRTSEGIRVFADDVEAATLTIGCILELTDCLVEEYRSPSSALSVTGLFCKKTSTPPGTLRVVRCRQKLPTPLVLGAGMNGRAVPQQNIRYETSSPSVDIEALNPILEPELHALDFYESVEGMFVEINDPRVVGPINSYNELFVVPDGGLTSPYLNNRSSLVLMTGDGSGWSPQSLRVTLDSTQSYELMSTNDRFSGPFIGPLDYRFSYFTILPRSPLPSIVRTILPKQIAPILGSSYLRVGSYNVLNLNPKCGSRCDDLAYHIVVNLGAPDILGLQEIQDNDGSNPSNIVDCDLTMKALIDSIKKLDKAVKYSYTQISPEYNKDGGEPNSNIRPVVMYRSDRVKLVSAPSGNATTAVQIVQGNATNGTVIPHLSLNPGRIDPSNPAFDNSRKPLAVEFTFRGESVFVINVHLSSRSGDTGLYERFQPQNLKSEPTRRNQAEVIRKFASDLLKVNNQTHVIVLGDFNEFEFNSPMTTIAQNLTLLSKNLTKENKYSYNFMGISQTIDHIFTSSSLLRDIDGQSFYYQYIHVNIEYSGQQTSDHEPVFSAFKFPGGDDKNDGNGSDSDDGGALVISFSVVAGVVFIAVVVVAFFKLKQRRASTRFERTPLVEATYP